MRFTNKLTRVALGAVCAATLGGYFHVKAQGAESDVVLASFDGADYGDWKAEGTAFGKGPARGTLPNQMDVSGYLGAGLVNSYFGGDASTGKLTSPEFLIVKPYLNFLIGGGGLPGTRMELIVDGQVVRETRGPNTQPGGSEALDWSTWNVDEFKGKKGQIVVVDSETGGWGHINVDEIRQSDKRITGLENVRNFKIDKRYLIIPIDQSGREYWCRLEVDGKIEREFQARLALEDSERTSDDFDACVDVGPWLGKELNFIVEKAFDDANFATPRFSDKVFEGKSAYDERYRPQFHFSPRIGWTNDPNGLVYYNGTYHLFYQHNPFSVNWGNMTWGHAVSNDLLHWTEVGDALYPDRLGTIFSGSGAVDFNNTTGFQKDPNGPAPLVFMFTQNGPNMRYGEPASQSLAYSLDEGKTLHKYEGNPTLPHIVGGNRDPKIFWFEPTQRWIAALYMDKEDYAIFESKDLKEWTQTCSIENLGCSECPDIFELPVDGDESKKVWVFWGGDGKYLLGTFDGKTFKKEAGPFAAKWGGNDYAAQSYSDTPGRRIQFSWMSGGAYPGMPFNQQFSVPRELTLRSTPDGVRLAIMPIAELTTLRGDALDLTKTVSDEAAIYDANIAERDLLDLEATLDVGDAKKIDVEFRGRQIELDLENGKATCDNVSAPLSVVDSKIKLRMVLDRTSLEIFVNDGLSQIAKCFVPDDENNAPIFKVSEDCVDALKVYPMRSVWNNR